MSDNPTVDNGSLTDYVPATKEVSHSGDTAHVQLVELAFATGAEGARTLVELSDANGVLVNLGANNDVTVAGVATAANQSTVIGHLDGVEGLLTTIDADTSTLAGAVVGTEMQVDVLTQPARSHATDSVRIGDGTDLALVSAAGALLVDASATTQPVSGTVSVTGVATSANQLPDGHNVTVDNAAGASAVNIQDGGNSITVDGTVAISGTVTVAAHAVTNAGTFAVQESGAALTALQLLDNVVATEDGPHNTGDAGVMALAVRHDAGGTLAGTTGDYAPLQLDSSGNLRVNIAAGAAAGGTSATDEAAYTPASSSGTPIMGAADEAAPDAAAEGTLAIIRSTLSRALHVNLRDASGNEVSPGGGTQYTEDAAAAADPVGGAQILVRQDTLSATTVSADGDNIAARAASTGAQYVEISAGTTKLGNATDGLLVNLGTNNDVTVTGTVTANLAAGTNNIGDVDVLTLPNVTIGTMAALVAGTANIGDVDVLTVPAPLSTTGGGTEATALRVTIANDSTGVVSVDDNGGSLTVDGTVTANLAAGTNNIGDVDILSIAAGDNNIGNVDIVTMPNVTLAAGTNTNEVVGDVAHSAGIAGNPLTVGGVAIDTDDTAPPNRVDAEADATRIGVDRDGSVFVRTHGPQIWSYHLDTSSAQTDATVHAAPGAGLSLYVTSITFSSGSATAINLFFEEGASKVLGPYYLEAVAGRGMHLTFPTPKKITANTALTLTTSAAIAHSVDVMGYTAQG